MLTYPDVSGYDERGFAPPVEPGNYIITLDDIHDAAEGGGPLKDKNGEIYLRFIFKIKGHPNNTVMEMVYPDISGPYEATRGGRIKQMILAFGLDPKGGDWSAMLHKSCRALIKVREYTKTVDGTPKTYQVNNIAAYEPLDGTEPATAPPADDNDPGF
jgi:hypothetical protein